MPSRVFILKEPNEDAGRRGQALEQLAKIFETATEKLETRHENRTQTSSMPTTKANVRTTPRVHSRLTRNNTPGIIPHRKATPTINTDRGREVFPQPPISEGGQNSEGGQKNVRKRTINPRSETERIKREKRNHSPVWSVAQPISARDAIQENRRMTKQVQEQIAAKQAKQTSQMEPKRVNEKLTTRQTPENSQRELHYIDETFQPERKKWRTSNPSF